MIIELNLNLLAANPILAKGGSIQAGAVPIQTVGDNGTLVLRFWEGATSKRITNFTSIKFGSKVNLQDTSAVLFIPNFTEDSDFSGYTYSAPINLNTAELITALEGKASVDLFTDIEITYTNGHVQTLQFKQTVRNQVINSETPAVIVQENYPAPSDIELKANKGAENGYAGLDGAGKVPSSQLPTANSTTPGVVRYANSTERNSAMLGAATSGTVLSPVHSGEVAKGYIQNFGLSLNGSFIEAPSASSYAGFSSSGLSCSDSTTLNSAYFSAAGISFDQMASNLCSIAYDGYNISINSANAIYLNGNGIFFDAGGGGFIVNGPIRTNSGVHTASMYSDLDSGGDISINAYGDFGTGSQPGDINLNAAAAIEIQAQQDITFSSPTGYVNFLAPASFTAGVGVNSIEIGGGAYVGGDMTLVGELNLAGGSGNTATLTTSSNITFEPSLRLVRADNRDLIIDPTRIMTSHNGVFTISTNSFTEYGICFQSSPSKKLAFYGATPVTQPSAITDATDAASAITQLNSLLAKLRTLGLIAT